MILDKEEIKTLQLIENKYYMKPIVELIQHNLNNNIISLPETFNNLYSYLTSSNKNVEKLIAERVAHGEIKDIKQAKKSIAGHAFSNLIIWCFLKNKESGYIKENIFISSKISTIKDWEKFFIINVDNETQKPDADIIIYSINNDKSIKKCIILSLKTSLRERAGQTYKWKLLMEIANADSHIKEKYNISYNPPVLPFVCFATVNFYDEINSPQHKGMFKFFDCAFIGKNIETEEFIKPLSYIIEYVNENLI